MATFEGLAGMQTLSVPSGTYVKMSPDQLARAARYGIQRNHASLRGYTARENVLQIFTSCWKGQYRHSGRMRLTVTSISSRSSLVNSVENSIC